MVELHAVARSLLTHNNFDPLIVAEISGASETDCWDYLDAYSRALNEYAEQRDEAAIRADARDWAEQLPEAFETKRLILLERLQNATTNEEKQQRLNHYKIFTGKLTSLSPEQIERARNYPLKDLIGTNKDITNCPFHDDKTASLNIKNNYYFCHGCGEKGDTIDFMMKRDNITFAQAVINLQ